MYMEPPVLLNNNIIIILTNIIIMLIIEKLIEDLVSFLINHININLILVNENDKDNEYYILLSNYFLNIPLYIFITFL